MSQGGRQCTPGGQDAFRCDPRLNTRFSSGGHTRQGADTASTLAEFPPRTETTDANGITTIVEYRLNDEGKKVKVTRKIKRTLVKTTVNHVVAERMGWAK